VLVVGLELAFVLVFPNVVPVLLLFPNVVCVFPYAKVLLAGAPKVVPVVPVVPVPKPKLGVLEGRTLELPKLKPDMMKRDRYTHTQ